MSGPNDVVGATPRRRRRLALWALTCCLASGVAGSLAGSQMTSSAEAAADRRPPDSSVLTATVERRVLRAEIITRGTLARASEFPLVAQPPADPTIGSVVTATPLQVGASLQEGVLAVEVGGRPVIALQGALPVFRDLRLGDKGVDVDQLRAALGRLRLISAAGPGPFDTSVLAGIRSLYAGLGYLPATGGKQATDALAAARAQLQAAQTTLANLTSGHRDVSRAELLEAEAAVAAAGNDRAVADAETEAAVDSASRRHAAATQELAAARSALLVATERLRQAEQEHRNPDTGKPPTAAELEAFRQGAATARATERAADLAEAQAAHDVEIATLQRTARMAAADAAVALATTRLEDLSVLPPATQGELDAARLAVRQATDALTEADRAAAPFLPRSEVVYLPTLPRTVTKTPLVRGDTLTGPFAHVSSNDLQLEATLPASSAGSAKVGTAAIIDDVASGVEFQAQLVEVATTPIKEGADAGKFAVRLVPVGTAPERAIGISLRIRLPIESTDGEALVVPATALRTAVDGSVFVEKVGADGTERIPVEVTLSASGLAAVKPAEGRALAAGDKVIVGEGT